MFKHTASFELSSDKLHFHVVILPENVLVGELKDFVICEFIPQVLVVLIDHFLWNDAAAVLVAVFADRKAGIQDPNFNLEAKGFQLRDEQVSKIAVKVCVADHHILPGSRCALKLLIDLSGNLFFSGEVGGVAAKLLPDFVPLDARVSLEGAGFGVMGLPGTGNANQNNGFLHLFSLFLFLIRAFFF